VIEMVRREIKPGLVDGFCPYTGGWYGSEELHQNELHLKTYPQCRIKKREKDEKDG